MRNELTNLLPNERLKALRYDYFLRLSIVAVSFLIAIILVSAVLLLPTYIYLTASARAKEDRISNIESTLFSADEAVLSERLITLSNNVASLAAIADAPHVSIIMREVLDISHPGIALSSFLYSPATGKKPGTLSISGSSATRDALRVYQTDLQSAPFVKSADLPVSAYAKDTDIAFTITVILAL